MPCMTWKDSMSVGVPSIDEQHKKLVGMLNELFEGMNVGKGKEVLGRILDKSQSKPIQPRISSTKRSSSTKRVIPMPSTIRKSTLPSSSRCSTRRPSTKRARWSVEVGYFLSDWLTNHIMGLTGNTALI